jgi:ubiquinone/menaquinone biosynthesis C-methylase UbiE
MPPKKATVSISDTDKATLLSIYRVLKWKGLKAAANKLAQEAELPETSIQQYTPELAKAEWARLHVDPNFKTVQNSKESSSEESSSEESCSEESSSEESSSEESDSESESKLKSQKTKVTAANVTMIYDACLHVEICG